MVSWSTVGPEGDISSLSRAYILLTSKNLVYLTTFLRMKFAAAILALPLLIVHGRFEYCAGYSYAISQVNPPSKEVIHHSPPPAQYTIYSLGETVRSCVQITDHIAVLGDVCTSGTFGCGPGPVINSYKGLSCDAAPASFMCDKDRIEYCCR